MKQFVLACLFTASAGMLSAVSVGWTWTSNGADWQENASVYMVYTASSNVSGTPTGADVVSSVAGGNYGSAANAQGDAPGSSWSAGAALTESATSSPALFKPPSSGNNNRVAFDLGNLADGSYNFYLVVFNNQDPSKATSYAVAQAGETGVWEVKDNQIVLPDQDPVDLPYLDPVWIAGTYSKAAPEPTALALLALGLAGAALRRRVR